MIRVTRKARVRTQGRIRQVLHSRAVGRVNTRGPSRQRIGLILRHAIRIVTGQAHRTVHAILSKKVFGAGIGSLHVRVVAGRALDVAIHQFDRAGWIRSLAIRRQRGHQAGPVFQRSQHTDGMRGLKIIREYIGGIHLAHRRHLA